LSAVISVRIPKRLKSEMDEFSGEVNWSEEIRKFLEKRVRELRKEKTLARVRSIIERLPEQPQGTAAGYVREDRDSR